MDQVFSSWRPSDLVYLGLIPVDLALEWAEFDASTGRCDRTLYPEVLYKL